VNNLRDFEFEPRPEPSRKEILQRRLHDIIIGSFEIGYELGRCENKPNKEKKKK